jgi:hypothetical protein
MSAIARLQAILGMDTSQYSRDIGKAQKETASFLQDFKKQFASFTAAGLAADAIKAVAGAVMDAREAGLELADSAAESATQLGLTASQLQAVRIIAKASGVEVGTLEKSLSKLSGAQQDLATGEGSAKVMAASLERMGMSADQLTGTDLAGALEAVSRGYIASGRSAGFLADAQNILGERSYKLRTVFESIGQTGLDVQVQALIDKGLVLSDVTAEAINIERDQQEAMKAGAQIIAAKTTATYALAKAHESQAAATVKSAEADRKASIDARQKLVESVRAKKAAEDAEKAAAQAAEAKAKEQQAQEIINRDRKPDLQVDELTRIGGYGLSRGIDQMGKNENLRALKEVQAELKQLGVSLPDDIAKALKDLGALE